MSRRKAIHNKTLPRSEELERILVKDFYLKIIISGQRPYFIKDFLQRFTYGLFCRDSA